jgi:hypothetical protein
MDNNLLSRQALRAAVVQAFPSRATQFQWANTTVPTLTNAADILHQAVTAQCAHSAVALRNDSIPSELDDAEGNWEPVLQNITQHVSPTIDGMSTAFDTHIIPLGSAIATRSKHWRSWRTVLTWAAGRDALARILPMDPRAMRALLWEAVTMGASKSVLKALLDAILSRHRDAGLPSPLAAGMTYTQLFRCVGRLLGKQHKHKFPITKDMVQNSLRFSPRNNLQFRNKLVLAVSTIGIMRPGETIAAQSCDFEFDGDLKKGLTKEPGLATLHTLKRKQDQERKGHHMRFGKSTDPALDINHQVGLYMDRLGIRPLTTCTKTERPHARCKCPPLFPRLVLDARTQEYKVAPSPKANTSNISAWVGAALKDIGVNASGFSGVCCRMGGLTVAIEAGVPEHVLWMQSGHAQDRAARRYVRLQDPAKLYDTWRAFQL